MEVSIKRKNKRNKYPEYKYEMSSWPNNNHSTLITLGNGTSTSIKTKAKRENVDPLSQTVRSPSVETHVSFMQDFHSPPAITLLFIHSTTTPPLTFGMYIHLSQAVRCAFAFNVHNHRKLLDAHTHSYTHKHKEHKKFCLWVWRQKFFFYITSSVRIFVVPLCSV